jgi:PAS domain S-box-containing protein
MSSFRDRPLKSKLRVIIMVTTGTALVLATAAFVAYDFVSSRSRAVQRLSVLAQVVADQATAALDFHTPTAAEQTLAKLAVEPQIRQAAVYDAEGTLFARYAVPGSTTSIPKRPGDDAAVFEAGHLRLFHPIVSKGERLGWVFLRSDLAEMRSRLLSNAAIAAGVLLTSALIALALSTRLERLVSGPVQHLAETVRRVTQQRDYAVRAEKHSADELGTLIDGLNDMLSQIQVRDGALQLARNELELRVDERTSQLQFVNDELQNEVAERKRAEASVRESEERYRQLVELSPDAILIHSDLKIDYVNSAALELLHARGPAELVGRPVLDIVAPELRGEVEAKIRRVYEGGFRTPLYEEKVLRLDGAIVDVEVAAISFLYQGRPAAQVIIRDITQRKEVDRMKNEFVSTVSHELRTPLTSIQGSLGLIANGVLGALPPAAKPLVDIAHKNCQRLVLLINDILDVEKIAAGKMKFAMKPLELMPLVEHALESNRSYAAGYGVKLELGQSLPGVRVNGDADRLIQVFTNLLSNAAKFSPKDGIVTLSVSRRDGFVRVAFSDRGSGIPEEFRSRIFQKFSQADSSDVRLKGGTGLGLSICKSITEKHDGRISFETETGRGTTFFVDLPELVEGAPASDPAPVREGGRVLVVEDDPQVAGFILMILAQDGFSADIAGSAAEALKRLDREAYDVMTLDLLLPDREGSQFLGELRKTPAGRDLPVIVVSALPQQDAADLAAPPHSVIAVLDKPIEPARLRTTLRAAMEKRQTARRQRTEGAAR